jgi:hypothetical protein
MAPTGTSKTQKNMAQSSCQLSHRAYRTQDQRPHTPRTRLPRGCAPTALRRRMKSEASSAQSRRVMDFEQASRQTLRAFWSASFGSVTLFETLAGLLVPWCWPGARLQGCRFPANAIELRTVPTGR